MSGPNYGLDKGHVASAAVVQFAFVTLGAAESVATSTAGQLALGVAQEACPAADATNNRVIDVRYFGISRAIAGAAIAIGARVVTDGTGRVVTATATTAKQNQVGIALQASAAANDAIDVFLTPGVQIDT